MREAEGRPAPLRDVDRRVVRDTLEELATTASPVRRARLGCPAALLGLVLLLGWPRVVDAVPGGDFVSPFVMLTGVLLVLGGPAVALAGGAGGRRAAEAAVEAALRRLEDPETDRATAVRAATLLVAHAYPRAAPPAPGRPEEAIVDAAETTFDPTEAAVRIGSRLSLVLAVETHLVEEGEVRKIFTLALEDG